jgi:PAS domain S-box-containing protein
MRESREQALPQLADMSSSAIEVGHANEPATPVQRSPPSFGVRSWLAGLTIVSVLLTCIPSGFLIWRSYQSERANLKRHSLETARALTLAIDGEFARMIATVNALATSPFLDAGNFAAFHRQAEAALPDYPGGSISLADQSGRQLINTLRQPGEALPERANKPLLRRVFGTGQPAISDLFVSAVTQQPLVAVAAPVVRDGKVVYDMTMAVPPESFATLLLKQSLPPGWVGGIGDSTGTIVARTHAPERFIGQRFGPELWQGLAQEHEGMIEMVTLEDIPVFTAFSRSSFSGWTVAIAIPRAELNGQVWRSMWITACGVLALLAAGLTLAFLIGRRITRPIKALTAPALAVGRGERVEIPTLGLREADELGRSLESASRLLRKRAKERDRAEEDRARAETWLRVAMEAGGMGTWEFNPITYRVVASESTDAIFGLSGGGRIRSVADYMRSIHPQDVERLRRENRRAGEPQGDISVEYRLVRPDGGTRWIASRGSNVRAPDGSKRIIGALFDITERKAAEAALAKALQDKEALLAQKEMLLREINHRVKNSLQSVSAMLRLQASHSRDTLLGQQLLQADQRVLIIARVHEQFYQAEAADRVEVAQYLHDLCGSLEKAASRVDGSVSIVVEADRSEMATDQALALALLVNELVTNALKYAFEGKSAGTVTVMFRVEPDGRRRLCVADDGNGLPEGFAPEQSSGLGMKLVQGFVRSLDGELIIDSSQSGSRFTVLMPPAASVQS